MAKPQHSHGYQPVRLLLHQMRETAGLTQRQLASKLKRGQPYIHKSEVGTRRVDCFEFAEWCRACNADPVEQFRTIFGQHRDRQ